MSLVDSPGDQSENLELLARIERQLDVHSDNNDNRSTPSSTTTISSIESTSSFSTETVRDLWTLVLDVVFAPLWLRLRAAQLLSICCDNDSNDIVVIRLKETYKLRAIVSSTCQAIEELDPTDATQAAQLFTWLDFLERVLLATHSNVCSHVLCSSMYAGMLTKMLRLLSACSTKVFAATTICLGLFHFHEKKCERLILVGEVLRDMKDGREYLSGALLHVINSCGCPCPMERVIHLWNALQLFGDILADETASELVFLNDYKVLIDLIIRECTDLPQEDITRLHFMELLKQVMDSPLYLQAKMYRKREVLELLESLLQAGVEEESTMPENVVESIKHILVRYIDLLD
ncbi:unnamed protein product [Peronospora belbahrii]|uniref:SPIN90/Ldb17 leucine-rich domain-containing protein n=1 Tax=Peronospora belbahrii TaxID=622444 RepID=A0AAU9L0V6_9STRA|nr:unnamed protein product [Peronospora belbahrii]CAH0519482.1 unnamed protein product [Peronospora belbahrii]